jgi:hypothetical protein
MMHTAMKITLTSTVNNEHYSRSKPLSVVVALDQAGEAHGLLYLDDGVSIGQFLATDMPCCNVATIAVIVCYNVAAITPVLHLGFIFSKY